MLCKANRALPSRFPRFRLRSILPLRGRTPSAPLQSGIGFMHTCHNSAMECALLLSTRNASTFAKQKLITPKRKYAFWGGVLRGIAPKQCWGKKGGLEGRKPPLLSRGGVSPPNYWGAWGKLPQIYPFCKRPCSRSWTARAFRTERCFFPVAV